MLKKETITALGTALGIPDLEAKIADTKEHEIDIAPFSVVKKDEFEVIPKADYTTRIENIEKESFGKGKTAGEETTKKELKKIFGVDVAGAKKLDPNAFATLIKEKVIADAKLPTDEKVKEIERDRDAFKQKAADFETKYTGLETTYKKKEKNQRIQTEIFGAVPAKTKIAREDVVELAMKKAKADGIEWDIDETSGGVVFKKGDGILKDANRNPLKAADVFKTYFEPYAEAVSGGAGGTDNPGGAAAPGTLAAFDKEWVAAGKKIGDVEYLNEMSKRIKDKTLKV